MLNHNSSQIAACALILAINIQKMSQYVKESFNQKKVDNFFKKTNPKSSMSPTRKDLKEKSFNLNVSMWNNYKVYYHTGYTIEMVKDCLYDFCQFIQKNLYPNKLMYFNIEYIKTNSIDNKNIYLIVYSKETN